MAKLTISFKPKSIICAAWVDRQGVDLDGGEGEVELPEGDHKFAWMVLGDPGQTATVTTGGGWTTSPTPIPIKVNAKHYASGAKALIRVQAP